MLMFAEVFVLAALGCMVTSFDNVLLAVSFGGSGTGRAGVVYHFESGRGEARAPVGGQITALAVDCDRDTDLDGYRI